MRSILLNMLCLLTAAGAMMLDGCKNDEDPGPTHNFEDVLWTQTSYEYTDCENTDNEELVSLSCTDQNCITVIYANGIATLTEVTDGDLATFSFPYSLIGNTISSGGLTATFTLDENMLVVRNEDVLGCSLIETWSSSN